MSLALQPISYETANTLGIMYHTQSWTAITSAVQNNATLGMAVAAISAIGLPWKETIASFYVSTSALQGRLAQLNAHIMALMKTQNPPNNPPIIDAGAPVAGVGSQSPAVAGVNSSGVTSYLPLMVFGIILAVILALIFFV